MLEAIYFKDFRSFKEATLPLAPLTLLIGANASGKSNALEGIRLLQWLGTGEKLGVIKRRIAEEGSFRGRMQTVGRFGEPRFTLGCTTNQNCNQFRVTLCIRDDELHIFEESVYGPKPRSVLYSVVEPATPPSYDLNVRYNSFTKGQNPRVLCTDQQAVFTQLVSPAPFQKHKKAQEKIPPVMRELQNTFELLLFLDPIPSKMRDAGFITEKTLHENGSNVSSILYRIVEEQGLKEDVLGCIRSVPEQAIVDITFDMLGPERVLIKLRERFGDHEHDWDATMLSDGTLRVLAIAAALLSAREGSLVVIEEVDNGVHPSRARDLMAAMHAIATRRSLRLLLSTHNPALMDAVPDPALDDVVLCYRDPREGDSRLVRLGDVRDGPALLSRASLGHLVTTLQLDQHVKHPVSDEERRQRAHAWLERMMSDQDA